MFTSLFTHQQLPLFSLIAILLFISIYFFSYKNNIKYAMLFLLIAGAFMRFHVIFLDDFLHLWDEQFHALVAKNLAANPLKPLLFKDAPLDYNRFDWSGNHVWLHKQPLFLWQIALSIQLFGESVFAVRLPSAIMICILIFPVFRIGKLIINEQAGYFSAFLFSINHFLLELNTKTYHTNHNDIAFLFFITLSIWAYAEYAVQKKTAYVWLIGFFAGLAILNKWMAGLLVFSGWGLAIFFINGIKNKWFEIKILLKSVSICALVFIPWQMYILYAFPIASSYEFSFNTKHFFEVVEGHGGNYWYHFEQAMVHYGNKMALLIPLALFIFIREIKYSSLKFAFLSYVIFIYLFFTLAMTKLPAFCLVVSPIICIALATFLISFLTYLRNIKRLNIRQFSILAIVGTLFFHSENFYRNHILAQADNSIEAEIKMLKRASAFAKSLKDKYSENAVILNCKKYENIPIMFYAGYIAYDRIPTISEISSLKKNNYDIFYIDDYSSGIPEFISNDTGVTIITREISTRKISLKAKNNQYVCIEEGMYSLAFANKESPEMAAIISLLTIENNTCLLRSDKKKFFCSDLSGNGELYANRDRAKEWETFSFVELDSNKIAFKAANGRYLSFDEESLGIAAKGDSIGINEKFELTIH